MSRFDSFQVDSRMMATFTVTFLGQPTEFTYTVSSTYAVRLDFTISGTPYSFDMTRWSGRGLKKFLPLFYDYSARDEDRFGRVEERDEGYLYHASAEQKQNVVLQTAKDVLVTINLIYETHGRGIVDYCIWYREHHDSFDTYARYVTLVACHNVVHSELLAPRVTWATVTFPEQTRE